MDPLVRLAPFIELGEDAVFAAFAVFMRVGAAIALLPGFGESSLPPRVKLAAAVAFAMVVWPAILPTVDVSALTPGEVGFVFVAEAVAGLILGLSVRLLILALQTAGAIAAQSASVSQMFGGGMSPEPQTAYSNILAVGGVALAFALGLPAYAAAALVESYDVLPFGRLPLGSDVANWGVARVADAFASAISLASPFIVAAFAYNVALGAINRAMPQLMVAFIGAPAITAGAILLMALATPLMMRVWGADLTEVMRMPFEARP